MRICPVCGDGLPDETLCGCEVGWEDDEPCAQCGKTWEGTEDWWDSQFCCQDCADKFMADPNNFEEPT
jgi:hypothetical protein